MDRLKARGSGSATLDCYTNEGTVRVLSKTITVKTGERTELLNLTPHVRSLVEMAGIRDGFVQVASLHTTAGLFINEWQDALLADVKSLLERMAPSKDYYKHNDPEFSDCDRKNADAHLRNIVLGFSLSIPVSQGELVLGRWQSVILAELDGPNKRNIFMQVMGI